MGEGVQINGVVKGICMYKENNWTRFSRIAENRLNLLTFLRRNSRKVIGVPDLLEFIEPEDIGIVADLISMGLIEMEGEVVLLTREGNYVIQVEMAKEK